LRFSLKKNIYFFVIWFYSKQKADLFINKFFLKNKYKKAKTTKKFNFAKSFEMIFLERQENNPYFNIAAEEYVLKNFSEDVLMLWESKESVVVGKHQNAFAEINYPFLIDNRIPLIRRISGGGTVYHCKGNINITVLKNSDDNNGTIDFHAFTTPLIEFLKGFNLNAKFEGKNNLTIDGLKFSGNSAHIYKNKSLHHGTILFDADLTTLESIINTNPNNFNDKSVKSIVAKVTNLKPLIKPETDFKLFKDKLKTFLLNYYNISKIHYFTKFEKSEILKLMQSRYKSWDWNFAYSPNFEFNNELMDDEKVYSCNVQIIKGIIDSIEIREDNREDNNELVNIASVLKGKKLMQMSINSALNEAGLEADKIKIILKLLHLLN